LFKIEVGFGLWDSVDFGCGIQWILVSPLGPCLPGSSVVAFVPPVPKSAVSTSKSLVRTHVPPLPSKSPMSVRVPLLASILQDSVPSSPVSEVVNTKASEPTLV
jgi:hypothetical protein